MSLELSEPIYSFEFILLIAVNTWWVQLQFRLGSWAKCLFHSEWSMAGNIRAYWHYIQLCHNYLKHRIMHLQLCLYLLHWHHLVCFGSLKYLSAIKLLSILQGTCWYFYILNRQIQGLFISCTCFLALGCIHFMSVLSTLDVLYPVPNGQTGRHTEPGFSEYILVQAQFQVSMKYFEVSVL
jgi:hypothetical protein